MISITVQGQEKLLEQLDKLAEALDTEEILDQAAALMLARIRQRFLTKLTPDGDPWFPSKRGLKRSAAGGPGTLYDTGRLFRSIQLFAEEEPNTRTIGTDVFYAPFLQFNPAKNWIFLGFGEEDRELAQDFVLKRIAEALS